MHLNVSIFMEDATLTIQLRALDRWPARGMKLHVSMETLSGIKAYWKKSTNAWHYEAETFTSRLISATTEHPDECT
jgi:hypothetical protein